MGFYEHGVFIVERSSGLLVAASVQTEDIGDYLDIATSSRVAASASPNDLIRFTEHAIKAGLAAGLAVGTVWPDHYTFTAWASRADAVVYPALTAGDAYYMSTSVLRENGLVWDLVTVEKVNCLPGTFADEVTLMCLECTKPDWSGGNAPKTCDQCVPGFFKDHGVCTECPEGATCDGTTSHDDLVLNPGFWRITDDSSTIVALYACPSGSAACLGGANFSNGGNSYCAVGYTGPVCAVCVPEVYYFNADSGTCEACEPSGSIRDIVAGASTLVKVLGGLMVAAAAAAAALYAKAKLSRSENRDNLEAKLAMRKKFNAKLKKFNVTLKQLTSMVQIASSIGFNCAITFPPVIERAFASVEVLNLDVMPSLGLNCRFSRFDYVDKVIVTSLAPLALCAVLAVAYKAVMVHAELTGKTFRPKASHLAKYSIPEALESAFTAREVLSYKRTFAYFDDDESGEIDEAELASIIVKINKRDTDRGEAMPTAEDDAARIAKILADSRKSGAPEGVVSFASFVFTIQQARKRGKPSSLSTLVDFAEGETNRTYGQSIMYLILFVTFLVLAGNSTTLLHYFNCRSFPEAPGGERRFLVTDYSIDCDSSRYKSHVPFVVLMILLYPLGIPALYFAMLWSKKHLLSDPEYMKRAEVNGFPATGHIIFLVEAYKPSYYW